jgi:6-phosphogluconolactonase
MKVGTISTVLSMEGECAKILAYNVPSLTCSTESEPVLPQPTTMNLYIGTYTKDVKAGVLRAEFDTFTGAISLPTVAAATPNPSWLALSPDGRQLLAANESGEFAGKKGGGISSFKVENDGTLIPNGTASLPGGPCHLSFDKSGRYAFAATYGAGTVAAFKSDSLERTALIQHESKSASAQQPAKAHSHQALMSPDNRFLCVADLGLDKILTYKLDSFTGALMPNDIPFVALPAGSGPRHLAWSVDGAHFYVVGELNNTITVFRYHASEGAAEQLQTLSTLPGEYKETSYIAEVAVHPNGRFLYVSNRGHNSIAIFVIGVDGKLTACGHAPTEGRHPRHFTISPDGRWLLAANGESNSIIVFRIDGDRGSLVKTSLIGDLTGQPVCLLLT